MKRFVVGRAALILAGLFFIATPSRAEQYPRRPQEPPQEMVAVDPVLANICPKFVLQGVPRRIKLYGAHLAGVEIEYEGEELVFRDYEYDPGDFSFTVVVEATSDTPVGKHVLKFVRDEKVSDTEIILYILKREDRALLQRDLVRCPWMTDQVVTPVPKR